MSTDGDDDYDEDEYDESDEAVDQYAVQCTSTPSYSANEKEKHQSLQQQQQQQQQQKQQPTKLFSNASENDADGERPVSSKSTSISEEDAAAMTGSGGVGDDEENNNDDDDDDEQSLNATAAAPGESPVFRSKKSSSEVSQTKHVDETNASSCDEKHYQQQQRVLHSITTLLKGYDTKIDAHSMQKNGNNNNISINSNVSNNNHGLANAHHQHSYHHQHQQQLKQAKRIGPNSSDSIQTTKENGVSMLNAGVLKLPYPNAIAYPAADPFYLPFLPPQERAGVVGK